MEFDWDSGNLKHIARHGIVPEMPRAQQQIYFEGK